MALGVDMVFCLAVLELKEEGYGIKLHCAIPCRNQECRWNRESIALYKNILSKADIVKLVSDEPYKPYLMEKRNEYMVDLADKVIAVWNGSYSGGTGHCVSYAEKRSKEIIKIDPTDIYGKGWTVTFFPWDDLEGKQRVAGRFKTTKEKDEFLDGIHSPGNGWLDEELATISVINDYNYFLPV